MKRAIVEAGVAMTVALSALYLSAPRAEEVLHHGVTVDSEGSVADCLSCHDGQIGKPVSVSSMIANYFGSHPVNRDYPPPDKSDFYVPAELVASAGIRLVNGQVTCISCHNLKNPEKYHLADSIDGSDLCFKCHKI
jgi:predicted CXXCH cytochrome family protein